METIIPLQNVRTHVPLCFACSVFYYPYLSFPSLFDHSEISKFGIEVAVFSPWYSNHFSPFMQTHWLTLREWVELMCIPPNQRAQLPLPREDTGLKPALTNWCISPSGCHAPLRLFPAFILLIFSFQFVAPEFCLSLLTCVSVLSMMWWVFYV